MMGRKCCLRQNGVDRPLDAFKQGSKGSAEEVCFIIRGKGIPSNEGRKVKGKGPGNKHACCFSLLSMKGQTGMAMCIYSVTP